MTSTPCHLPTPHVQVTLDAYGLPKIEAHNYPDGRCKLAVAPFEAGFGAKESDSKDKPEAAIPVQEEVGSNLGMFV